MQTLILALAAYRLTRMVTTDTIFDKPRIRIFRRYPPPGSWQTVGRKGETLPDGQIRDAHWIGKLIDCPWCIGFWIAGASVLTVNGWEGQPTIIEWLATSAIVGVTAGLAGD